MNTKHVLWTGGWDSTYRVLSLLEQGDDFVQPHYVVNPERLSYRLELDAIERIRSLAVASWGERLFPPLLRNQASIPVSSRARKRHARLVERFGIGPQYLWLSEYARTAVAEQLELCVHVDDKAYAVVQSVRNEASAPEALEEADPRRLILDHFAFPILEVSKLDMLKASRLAEYEGLMNLTWFCQIPTRSRQPCGFCNPCQWTIDEGLGHRVPLNRRIRLTVYRNLVAKLPGYRLRRALLTLLRGVR